MSDGTAGREVQEAGQAGAQDLAVAARGPGGVARLVRDALLRLDDPAALQTHPLAQRLATETAAGAGPARAGAALRGRLLHAIARLGPEGRAGGAGAGARRRHRLLELRYVEALDPRAVQRRLGIEKSQYYREHARALATLAAVLTEGAPGAAGGPARPGPGSAAPPPLRSAAPTPGRPSSVALPRPLTSFVGREREVADVREALSREGVRLLTLTGPGGVGKTRLALQAAAGLAGRFADGVAFVALAPLAEPAHVAPAVAAALGVPGPTGRPAEEAVPDHLRGRAVLLVLDNCEHVLPGAAPLVAALLPACPGLTVLATSREALRVGGEHVLAVPPLALPDRAAPGTPEHLASLAAAPAVRLFRERARAAGGGFALTPDNARAVVELCHRLDGLPLALELAAARTPLLPPPALLARLERRLPLLTGGPRDAPARQQTLRAAVAWSYDLLPPRERALFRRLAVFAGGASLAAAEAVGGEGGDGTGGGAGESAGGVLEGVGRLLDKSLVRRDELPSGSPGEEPRVVLLETVREFALERLEASGEAEAVRRRHAAFYLRLAEAARAAGAGACRGRSTRRGSTGSRRSGTTCGRRCAGGRPAPGPGRPAPGCAWRWRCGSSGTPAVPGRRGASGWSASWPWTGKGPRRRGPPPCSRRASRPGTSATRRGPGASTRSTSRCAAPWATGAARRGRS